MFWYGHPLITQGAGRIKTDPINQQRIQTVLTRFEKWAQTNNINSFQWTINSAQLQRSAIVFPLTGFVLGVLGSFTFVHPNSKYIGKLFTILTTSLGYGVYRHYQQTYQVSRRFGNYSAYPQDIRRMIDNNDSRYAYRWLKDQYLQIPVQNKPTQAQTPVQTQQSSQQ